MRHTIIPDVKQFQQHYLRKQQGGSLPGFRGVRNQKGYGIGSFFKSIARFAIPLVKRGAQAIGRRALKAVKDIGQDVLAGKNVKQAIKGRGSEAVNDLAQKGVRQITNQSGAGRKRKRVNSPIKANTRRKTTSRSQAVKKKTSVPTEAKIGPFIKYKS